MDWHIGCSGFHYRDWKGVFYPEGLPQKRWFEHYASQFDTLELNVTFYRFPRLSFLVNWYNISPQHFTFAVKAPRLITHYKQFHDCERLLGDFYGTITEGLKEKLGVVLFQMSPKYSYSEARLELIVQNLKPEFTNVLEFRHESWWHKDIYKKMSASNVIVSGMSHPTLPDEAIINNELVYYRFHGTPKLYYSEYGKAFLKQIADSVLKKRKVKTVYIYFNNTATMAAINNALWLKDYVKMSARDRTALNLEN